MRTPLLLAALLAFSSAAMADSIDALKAFVADTKTARASFTQAVLDKSGKVRQQSSGTMAFARPGKFRWVYQKPFEQVIVGDGSKIWLYDADLQQVTIKQLGQALGSSPAALLAGSKDIDKFYTLKDAGSRDGLEWLEATPKDKESTFTGVRMGFAQNTLAAMEIKDNFGQTTVLKFAGLERNPSLPASEFRFTPPKGVDVISDQK
ncbi:MAG: outer membrane lipoprotein chaperone LolA [Pseudomonadota bacterium]|jgi:outer membrane lipoprotein carrier protein|uniref:outer membrane lipoprotein chaperone LolA n=1 Tax=Sulfuriferula sp. TaxID=2025307 RepID=UPI0027310D94|nr:outer membrane lipoprotein chaperone LolA [Sulfuriferula sp.]MDP2026908.1 outer membrane lipoprotein chaperone LolA [Sulfuriferula sp.]